MNKKRALMVTLASIAFALLLLEVLLWFVDPAGLRYMVDIGHMLRASTNSPRGYAYAAGQYEFRRWSVTITADQTRRVPDTPALADCTIAFLGDSVTFGRGVDDAQTWVNLIAREYPEVRFINTGTDGYNSENVLLTYADVEADGYLWLVVGNDQEPAFTPDRRNPPRRTWLSRYLIWLYRRNDQRESDAPRLIEDMQQLDRRENLVMIAYDAPLWGIQDVVRTEQVLSAADPHPNAAGHRALAGQLMPYVEELIGEVCR